MFVVTIVLLCFCCQLVNMCKKPNELIQQLLRRMSWYVSNKDLCKVIWNVRSIHDKLHFDILLTWSNAYQQTSQEIYKQEKNANESLVQDDVRYRNIELWRVTVKLCKSQGKTKNTPQNGNSLEILASNLSCNYNPGQNIAHKL